MATLRLKSLPRGWTGEKPRRKRRAGSPLVDDLLRQIELSGLPKPVTEWRFHETRRWRLDLVFIEENLAVEIDGGEYIRGRHQRPLGYINDCRKLAEATIAGWRVLRVTGSMVRSMEALSLIERALGVKL